MTMTSLHYLSTVSCITFGLAARMRQLHGTATPKRSVATVQRSSKKGSGDEVNSDDAIKEEKLPLNINRFILR